MQKSVPILRLRAASHRYTDEERPLPWYVRGAFSSGFDEVTSRIWW